MPLSNEVESGRKVVKAPSVEFLLKQVYFAHREKVKTLEAEIWKLKTERSAKCTACNELKQTLEGLKKDHKGIVWKLNQQIETLENQLAIALNRRPDERNHLDCSTCLEESHYASVKPPPALQKGSDGHFSGMQHSGSQPHFQTSNVMSLLSHSPGTSSFAVNKHKTLERNVLPVFDSLPQKRQKVCSELKPVVHTDCFKENQNSNLCTPESCKKDLEELCNADSIILVPETIDCANNLDSEFVDYTELNISKNDASDCIKEKWKKVQLKKVVKWLNGCDIPETNCEEYAGGEAHLSTCSKTSEDQKENSQIGGENDFSLKNNSLGKSVSKLRSLSPQNTKQELHSKSNCRNTCSPNRQGTVYRENVTLCIKQEKPDDKIDENMQNVIKLMISDNVVEDGETWKKSPSLLREVSKTRVTFNSNKSVVGNKMEQKLEQEAISYASKTDKSPCRLVKETIYSKDKLSSSSISSCCSKIKTELKPLIVSTKCLRQNKLSAKKFSKPKKSKHQHELVPQLISKDYDILSDEVFDSPDSFHKHNSKIDEEMCSIRDNHFNLDDNQLEDSKMDETFLPSNFKSFSVQRENSLQLNSSNINNQLVNQDNAKIINTKNLEDFSEQSSEDLLLELQQASPTMEIKSHDEHEIGEDAPFLEEKDQIDSFDIVSEPAKPVFKYKEDPVRKKHARKQLAGHACKMCEKYYRELGLSNSALDERLKSCSKHRATNAPPPTPEHYWDLDFPDTQECKARGYLDETQKVQLKPCRKQPFHC